jgi:hypothetical protein
MFITSQKRVPAANLVRHRLRRAVVVAVAAVLLGVLSNAAVADAAATNAAGSSASQARVGVGTAATSASCTDNYQWYVSGWPYDGGYAKAEWTANSCGYLLQVRVWCRAALASGWRYSGVVKRVDLWDQAGCASQEVRAGSYIHFSYDGGSSWTAWKSI